jgi:hypothetical protein
MARSFVLDVYWNAIRSAGGIFFLPSGQGKPDHDVEVYYMMKRTSPNECF